MGYLVRVEALSYSMTMRFKVLFSHFFKGGLLCSLVACTGKDKIPELYLLQGACEVSVKTDDKHSDIYVDGILIGHGEAKTNVPCGQKKILVEAPGKKVVEEFQVVQKKFPLEMNYALEKTKAHENWALSPELADQLAKGEGPYDKRDPKYKEIAAKAAKDREEAGYYYTPEEMAAAAKKAAGGGESAEAGTLQIDPNTNFDDPKTWM